MQNLTHRDFIKNAGVATLEVITASGTVGTALSCFTQAKEGTNQPATQTPDTVPATVVDNFTELPRAYAKLDLDAVAERAYNAYCASCHSDFETKHPRILK